MILIIFFLHKISTFALNLYTNIKITFALILTYKFIYICIQQKNLENGDYLPGIARTKRAIFKTFR